MRPSTAEVEQERILQRQSSKALENPLIQCFQTRLVVKSFPPRHKTLHGAAIHKRLRRIQELRPRIKALLQASVSQMPRKEEIHCRYNIRQAGALMAGHRLLEEDQRLSHGAFLPPRMDRS